MEQLIRLWITAGLVAVLLGAGGLPAARGAQCIQGSQTFAATAVSASGGTEATFDGTGTGGGTIFPSPQCVFDVTSPGPWLSPGIFGNQFDVTVQTNEDPPCTCDDGSLLDGSDPDGDFKCYICVVGVPVLCVCSYSVLLN
jgi:hypothetical protein